MQNIGKDTTFRIERGNPDFLKSLEALPIKVRNEVKSMEEKELSINPFPRPGSRLIVPIRGKYKDIYRIRVAEKYRYIYHVESLTIYSRYVLLKGKDTYAEFRD